MTPYRNLNGKSGVAAYRIGSTFIDVRFVGGEIYRYSHRSAGPAAVERMKELALAGEGLAAYVSHFANAGYEFKF